MRFVAVLNRDGGTLRTIDLAAFSSRLTKILEDAGHKVDVEIVHGDKLVATLERASRRRSVDVIMAGGGDGTISAAAGLLMNKKQALAVLPAGTMNLFARSLGIPLDLDQAVAAFAKGEVRSVDVALANGQPFVHQFSIGMHAKMVKLREKMEFGSRIGKMTASARAAWNTIKNPPNFRADLKIGGADTTVKTSGIGVSNNLFGEGHLPYADHPDGGVLGIYVTLARQPGEMLRFAANAVRGKWHTNPHVDVYQATEMEIRIAQRSARHRCVIDGELSKLEPVTRIEIKPKSLNVLAPAAEKDK